MFKNVKEQFIKLPIPFYQKIAYSLLSLGVLGLLLSIIYGSTVLTFIGLTLAFWGCLFVFVLPGGYVKSEIMDHLSSSSLLAINQIIADSNVQGKAIYIPVPKEMYLPYLPEIKNEFVYIPKSNLSTEKTMEQAYVKSPGGLRLSPPGLRLANLMEKKSGLNFHDLSINSIGEALPSIITSELEIAREFSIRLEENKILAKIRKPVCEGLCKEVSRMRQICPHVGCPLSSSIACILTRVTNKPIMIERCSMTNGSIEMVYNIL